MTAQAADRRSQAPVVRTRYLLAIDAICILSAFVLGLLARYESVPQVLTLLRTTWGLMVLSLVVRMLLNRWYRLYSRMWRYASVQEAFQIVKITGLAGLTMYVTNFLILPFLGWSHIPSRSAIIFDWLFNLVFLGGSRLILRVGLNWLSVHNKHVLGKLSPYHRHVVIMGAGDMGTMVARMMQDNPELGYEPVGFTDDDSSKHSMHIRGLPVLGDRNDIPRIAKDQHVTEVVIAMSSAPQNAIDDICRICASVSLPTRVIPSLQDLVAGTLTVNQLRQWRQVNGHDGPDTLPMASTGTSFRLNNILVTGGAGFIGSNFVRYMLEKHRDYRIVVYDKLTYAGNLDNLRGLRDAFGKRFVFVQGDICDSAQVVAAMTVHEIDTIVNFAAETHVDRSLMEPDSFLNTNIYGTRTLLEAARQFRVVRYHQVSTDEVYGQVMRGSFCEEDPLETRSPYSASKAAADLLVHAYFASFGVPMTITRASNNIGPYQYPEKAVPLFITNALDDQPLPIYGDGLYVRDYQYVLDHCAGIDIILHNGVIGEIYNLGGGNELAAIDLASKILDRLGKPQSLIQLVTDRAGQDRRYSLNCSKAMSLGWHPEWAFDKALDATIEWYLANEWWWRKIKNGEYRHYYAKQYSERLEDAVHQVLAAPGESLHASSNQRPVGVPQGNIDVTTAAEVAELSGS